MSRGRFAIVLVLAVAGLAVASQLLLPGLAERRLRSELGEVGTVERVDVSAFPAVKVLAGRADRIVVRMSRSQPGQAKLADLLDRTRRTGELDVRVDELTVGPLRLRDATLRKEDDVLIGQASVTDADLQAAVPPGLDVRPVSSSGGQLVFEGTASAFGRSLTVRARVLATDGRLLVAPDVPFGGLASLTVFADDRVAVESVAAGRRSGGFILAGRARLRDG